MTEIVNTAMYFGNGDIFIFNKEGICKRSTTQGRVKSTSGLVGLDSIENRKTT